MFLITPTLHSNWRYYVSSEEGNKQSFLDVLNKVKTPQTEAMLNGITFENMIKSWDFREPEDEYFQCVNSVAETVRGGIWQQSVKKHVSISGFNFLLYGRTDVIKRDWIYDIKFTKNYDIGKYRTSIQHLLYMHCADMPKFSYLVSDGKSVFQEEYFWNENSKSDLMSEIWAMIDFIRADTDFREAYKQNWRAKYD